MGELYGAIAAECDLPFDGNTAVIEKHLIATRTNLVIDDFHRLSDKSQRAVIKRVKRLLEGGLTVVLVSIPDTAGTLITDDGELLFRSSAIKVPAWTEPELTAIAKQGFRALNVVVDEASIKFLVWQSAKNPLLVQEYCHRICRRFGIFERQAAAKQIRVGPEILSEILSEAGRDIGGHFSGLLSKSTDRVLKLTAGNQISLHNLILVTIAKLGVLQPLRFDTVAKKLRGLVAIGETVTASDVRIAVKQLTERLSGERSKDYAIGMDERYIFILHPYFKVFLLWHFAPSVAGERFPADQYFMDDLDGDD